MGFDIKAMQKGWAENFERIRKTHAEKGLPVLIEENGRIFELYIDDRKIDVTNECRQKYLAAKKAQVIQ